MSAMPFRALHVCLRVAASCALALAPACSRPETPPGPPPNVLILLGDTVRADHMSTYGYERATTPRIDAFAKRGRVYERAISPGAWTLPAQTDRGKTHGRFGFENP